MKIIVGILIALLVSVKLYSQNSAFSGINIQGSINLTTHNDVDLEFLIINSNDDTIWHEQHANVGVDEDGVFNLVLGHGTFINGEATDFNTINWVDVNRVDINRIYSGNSYLLVSLQFAVLPYAYFATNILTSPLVDELIDIGPDPQMNEMFLKYDGMQFNATFDLIFDTTYYSFQGNQSGFSDTATVCLVNQSVVDSSLYAVNVFSSVYSDTVNWSLSNDTATHAVYANVASFALNNWGKTGNENGDASVNFIGSDNTSFGIRTNNTSRLKFYGADTVVGGGAIVYKGFAFNTKKGFLVRTNTLAEVNSISGTFLYFNGKRSAFAGGEHGGNMDTSMALGSFVWGKNISTTRGKSATMFGENIKSDSVFLSGIWYTGENTFAHGKNITAGITCVAIGENITSNYIRNVAIGKNVYAGVSSASVGIGIDIVATGSTAWAVGHNLTASGHFSTLVGFNVGTSTFKGGFLFGDNASTTALHTTNHQFMARASGGVIFYSASDLSTGVALLPGAGSWNMVSDRNKKENIFQVDYNAYASNVFNIPVYHWSYIGQNLVHLGPMAQDFNLGFGIGELPNYINTLDIDGVTMIGIKSLNFRVNQLAIPSQVDSLQQDINVEKEKMDSLEYRIHVLYEKLNH